MKLKNLPPVLALAAALAGASPATAAPRPVPGAEPSIAAPPGSLVLTPTPALSCAGLAALALDNATIISAGTIAGGSFTPPPPPPPFPPAAPLTGLPTFCRVVIEATPTPYSLIKIEVWIPTDGSYRQRYLQVGNGGFSGRVVYDGLADGVRRGYATASTDDGSQTFPFADFAAVHREKVTDYGWRALEETNEKARAIVRALTGADPSYAYFHGCSNGGREALMMAQRYPDAFDGIAAGAPANFFTHQFAAFAYNTQKIYPPPMPTFPSLATPYIPAAKIGLLTDEVLQQCAGRDGGLPTDRFLTNPPACRVDLGALACAPGSPTDACLTADERRIVQAIYDGPRHERSGAQIYPGLEPGAESHPCNWPLWISGKTAADPVCAPGPAAYNGFQSFFGGQFLTYFVNGGTPFDIHTLNFGADIDRIDIDLAADLNAVDPDLRAFRKSGGKLLQYHGFDDAAVAPQNSIDYWSAVEARMRASLRGFRRADLDGFYRLFMAPGLSHCAGGDGANSFGQLAGLPGADADRDILLALERWVEGGVAPERIVARHVGSESPAFERPLCPYPKLPRYTKSILGPLHAASWACAAPARIPAVERILKEAPIVLPRD